MTKDIQVAFGVDVDAVAGMLGSYGGEDSPCDISRGLFSGEVGGPRLIRLFEKYSLPATWFVPGPLDRDLPGPDADDRRRRARNRRARVLA